MKKNELGQAPSGVIWLVVGVLAVIALAIWISGNVTFN